jgi:hypothetical protein
LEIEGEAHSIASFKPVIEFTAYGPGKLLHHLSGRKPKVDAPFQNLSELDEEVDVPTYQPGGFRPLDLDHHSFAARQHSPVDLADGSGRQRFCLETLKGLLDADPKFLSYDLLNSGEWNGRDLVLEFDQFAHNVRWHYVRPGAEKLAELDKGRAELIQHLPDVPAALRG